MFFSIMKTFLLLALSQPCLAWIHPSYFCRPKPPALWQCCCRRNRTDLFPCHGLGRCLFLSTCNSPEEEVGNDKQNHQNKNTNDDDDYEEANTSKLASTLSFTSRNRPLRRPIRRSIKSYSTTCPQEEKYIIGQFEKTTAQEEALKDPNLLSNLTFAELKITNANDNRGIPKSILEAIHNDLGLSRLTEIQAQTWRAMNEGDDRPMNLLGRARTGTGKSLAFLLPIVVSAVSYSQRHEDNNKIMTALIVVPTRELATQIAHLATILLQYEASNNPRAFAVQTVTGGTRIQRDKAMLNQRMPTILVASPGRLMDLLRLPSSNFKNRIADTKFVVLDEADLLLEAFSNEIQTILSYLPSRKRQTLLFSATMPAKLQKRLTNNNQIFSSGTYMRIDCVGDENEEAKQHCTDLTAQTNQRVKQSYLQLSSMSDYLTTLMSTLLRTVHAQPTDYKILVFFPTAKLVKFLADVMNQMDILPTKVLAIHSRMSPGARRRASSEFLQAKRAILFSSDVSARGVDYPDIGLVIQYGSPYSQELYLHRLGRTGRAGRKGEGLLVLLPFERRFVSRHLEYSGDKVRERILDGATKLALAFGLTGLPELPEDLKMTS